MSKRGEADRRRLGELTNSHHSQRADTGKHKRGRLGELTNSHHTQLADAGKEQMGGGGYAEAGGAHK